MSKRLLGALAIAAASVSHAHAVVGYGQLPIAFERNQGQTDASVDFLARGQGYGLFLTPQGAVLSLRSGAAGAASARAQALVLRMDLAGANPHARAAGVDALPGKSHYFVGSDPARWHAGVPNYAKVRYADVYPGIDLVYYGNPHQLEYDFVVAPSADPGAIAWDFRGAQSLRVDGAGNLQVATAGGRLVQRRPEIYQDVDGRRRRIDGRYVVHGLRASFRIAHYDRSRPLVIDPVLSYSSYLGGGDHDEATAIAVDAGGRAYVTGFTYSSDFPATTGTVPASAGDAFVARIDATGSRLSYATYLGGRGMDAGQGIAVDAEGDAYVTGYTRSADFPVSADAMQAHRGDGSTQNAFVVRLDTTGALRYSTYLGGSGSDAGQGIAVDAGGHAYVTGYASSSDFPTTPGVLQARLNGLQNAFVAKLDPSGHALAYSTLLGGDDYDFGSAIAIDAAGSAYVTGTTYGVYASTFPVTAGALQTASGGDGDAFVAKLDAHGAALVYSTFLGGAGQDGGRGIAVDGNGAAYVTGYTASAAFPLVGAMQAAAGGRTDAFVAKLRADGAALVYATYLGGGADDAATAIAVGSGGEAVVTGYTESANFPITSDAAQPAYGGRRMAFLARFDVGGGVLAHGTYLGGHGGDGGQGVALDPRGDAYVAGYAGSADFPTTAGAFQGGRAASAGRSAFVAKFAFAAPPAAASAVSGTPQSAVVHAAFAAPLGVRVVDAGGQPLAGVEVAFAAPTSGAGAALSAATALTDTDGVARVTATANAVSGNYVVHASVVALAGSTDFALSNTAGPAAALAVGGGAAQSATVATAFAAPLVVHVSDADGNAVADAEVAFAAPASGASAVLSAPSVRTDAQGDASITATANTVAGGYAVTARVAGVDAPATVALSNTAGAVAAIAASSVRQRGRRRERALRGAGRGRHRRACIHGGDHGRGRPRADGRDGRRRARRLRRQRERGRTGDAGAVPAGQRARRRGRDLPRRFRIRAAIDWATRAMRNASPATRAVPLA